MSTPPFVHRTLAALGMCAVTVAGVLAGAVTTASPSGAAPGPPGPGCMPSGFAYICDGPIRPDHTFNRCRISRPIIAPRNLYMPPVKTCWVVDLTGNPDFGVNVPQDHAAN